MTDTARIAESYIRALEARDWEAVAGLLAADVVYRLPQSRELISGRDRLLQFNREYPGDWHLAVGRLVADEHGAAVWVDARQGETPMDAIMWFEVDEADLISQITDFWPESYEPPAGREHLTERY